MLSLAAEMRGGLRFLGSRVRVWAPQDDVTKSDEERNVMIFLHGSGISAFGMEKMLQRAWKPPNNTLIVFPSAPMRPYDLAGGNVSSVWHNRKCLDIDDPYEDIDGIDEICEEMHRLSEQIRLIGGNVSSIAGFSMGAHLALHAVYRHQVRAKACCTLSAYLVNSSAVYGSLIERQNVDELPPLLYCHGGKDAVVPSSWAEETHNKLKKHGIRSTLKIWDNLEHDVNTEEMDFVSNWLQAEVS